MGSVQRLAWRMNTATVRYSYPKVRQYILGPFSNRQDDGEGLLKPSSTAITSSAAAYVVCECLIERKALLQYRLALLGHPYIGLQTTRSQRAPMLCGCSAIPRLGRRRLGRFSEAPLALSCSDRSRRQALPSVASTAAWRSHPVKEVAHRSQHAGVGEQ